MEVLSHSFDGTCWEITVYPSLPTFDQLTVVQESWYLKFFLVRLNCEIESDEYYITRNNYMHN